MKKLKKNTYTILAGFISTTFLVANLCHADEIVASFDRNLNHAAVIAGTNMPDRENNLPEQIAVNLTLWSQDNDLISKSFQHDLNHEPTFISQQGVRKADPVATLIRQYLLIQLDNENKISIARK